MRGLYDEARHAWREVRQIEAGAEADVILSAPDHSVIDSVDSSSIAIVSPQCQG